MTPFTPATRPAYVIALEAAYGAPSQAGFGSAVFYERTAASDDLEQAVPLISIIAARLRPSSASTPPPASTAYDYYNPELAGEAVPQVLTVR
jgi:hypothetical protein